MTKKVAVVSMKGGVGKTTIAVNLACALASQNIDVALVDADIQATASEWIALGKLPITGYAIPLESLHSVRRWFESEERIRRLVNQMLTVKADIEVIDLPPHLSGSAVASLAVCDLVVIPCGASAADISATAKTLELVERAREIRSGHPPVLIVPTRIDWRTGAGRAIESALAQFGEPIGSGIAQRVSFADSLSIGEWIGQYAPDSPGHHEIENLAEIVRGVLGESNAPDFRDLAEQARTAEAEAGGLEPEPGMAT
ncbi:MAG: ParA family protein [Alphaproteobacteria bacterium]